MPEEFLLSSHVSFFDLTRTNHHDLQEQNRNATEPEIAKLRELAWLLERVRLVIGHIEIHSGRRFLELNKRVGGSERSQHLKCEAADISPMGPDTEMTIEAAFQKIVEAAKKGLLKFGQLIVESDSRGREGRAFWIHISLGAPHRDAARCGEVLRAKDGKFEVIDKIA